MKTDAEHNSLKKLVIDPRSVIDGYLMAGRLKVAEKRGMGLLREIRGRIEPSSIWRCIDERGG